MGTDNENRLAEITGTIKPMDTSSIAVYQLWSIKFPPSVTGSWHSEYYHLTCVRNSYTQAVSYTGCTFDVH